MLRIFLLALVDYKFVKNLNVYKITNSYENRKKFPLVLPIRNTLDLQSNIINLNFKGTVQIISRNPSWQKF